VSARLVGQRRDASSAGQQTIELKNADDKERVLPLHKRDPEIREAFLSLACAILCFRRLQSF
jgi:hypothetical protein